MHGGSLERSETNLVFFFAHLNMSDKLNIYDIDIIQPCKAYLLPSNHFSMAYNDDDERQAKD